MAETFSDGKTPEEAGRHDAREAMAVAALAMKAAIEEKSEIYGPSPPIQKRLIEAMGKIEKSGGEYKPQMTTRGERFMARAAQTPDHADAWNVAHYRSEGSNLARAYIELRQLSKSMWEGPITDEEQDRLKAILHANDI